MALPTRARINLCRCPYNESGHGMLDRIAEFIERYEMFPPGGRVGVAVSGGADSVFLLYVLRELAPQMNLDLSVVHVDHGIRGRASHEDAEFVRRLAASFELPFHIFTANLSAPAGNLEEGARDVRRGVFAGLIEDGLVNRVATGHTRNDQAETVLYRMLRGASVAGLSVILPVTKEGLVP